MKMFPLLKDHKSLCDFDLVAVTGLLLYIGNTFQKKKKKHLITKVQKNSNICLDLIQVTGSFFNYM